MGFAAIHILGAPYFQCRVWSKISEGIQDAQRPLKIEGTVVHDSFKYVFMHDFGILAYAIILVASFVWSYMGATWIAEGTGATPLNTTMPLDGAANPCDQDGYAGWAAFFGECFFVVASLYTGCYYCCGFCASSVTIHGPPIVQGVPVE